MLRGYFLRAPLTHFRTALQRAGRGWCWNSASMLPCMPCAHAHEHTRTRTRTHTCRLIHLFPLSLAVIFKIPLKSENACFRLFLLHHFANLDFVVFQTWWIKHESFNISPPAYRVWLCFFVDFSWCCEIVALAKMRHWMLLNSNY